MFGLKLTPITKAQWVSIIKNALIAGVVAFVTVWSATGDPFSKSSLLAGATAAGVAAIKVVEKAFTQG